MNREQMIAWLTLEGWQLHCWAKSRNMLRLAKVHPQHKEKIWQFNGNRWVWAEAGSAEEYSLCPWDWLTDYQCRDIMEALK